MSLSSKESSKTPFFKTENEIIDQDRDINLINTFGYFITHKLRK